MSYKKTRIKAISGIVAQFRENAEVDVIFHEGIMYIPHYQALEEIPVSEDIPDVPKKKSKKVVEEVEDEPEEAKPAKKQKAPGKDDVKSQVEAVVTDFDSGDIIQAKATVKLMDLLGKSKGAIDAILTKFAKDDDAEIPATVKKLMAKTSEEGDEEEEEEETKPAKKSFKSAKGKKVKENLVDAADLEKGQKVSVYWGSEEDDEGETVEYNEWFSGVVHSTKGGVIKIKYDDDGAVMEYDEDLMEKIKLLDNDEEDSEDEDD